LLSDVAHTTEIAGEWAERVWWDVLPRVTCPTLLIEAQASITPPGQMARMTQLLPDARHLLVPGSSHLVHRSAPGAYRSAVETFLAPLRTRCP
jgi:pimeloyl-ACP methyl ester carboxylesterase